MRDNAAAASLIPSTEGGAPLVNVDHAAGGTAGAPGAVIAGAVATASVGHDDNRQDGGSDQELGEHENERER